MNLHLFPKFHSVILMTFYVVNECYRGRDMVETCRRLRDFIILTNELAALYTISGKGHDKKLFRNTVIFETVCSKYMLQENILIITVCTY